MKKKIVLAAVLAAFASSPVNGAEIKYDYEMESDKIIISGKVDSQEELVSFQLYSNEEGFDKNVTNENIDGLLVYSGQQSSGANGEFSFEFELKKGSGKYLARVGAESLSEALETEFYYSNPEELKAVYDNVSKITAASELKVYVEENIAVFNVDEDAYAALNNKQNIYTFLIENKEHTSFEEFAERLDEYITLQYLNEITDADTMLQKLQEYNDLTDIKEKPWYEKTFAGASDEQKESILNNLTNYADFSDFNKLNEAFMNETVKTAVLNNNWMGVNIILEDNADIFSDCIKNAEDREKAAKAIAGKSYNTLADIKSAISASLVVMQPVIVPSGSSGGSGSGGGSKVSSPSVLLPKVEEENKPVSLEEKKAPFEDMADFEWAEAAVTDLWRKNVISGVSETEFAPGKPVTREEFVAMIVRNFGFYKENEECDFDDVDENDWCYAAVASAFKNEIIFGVDENNFGKGEKITREDMCVIACRAAEKAGISFEDGEAVIFTDEISDYAKADIQKMCSAKILSGMGDGYFGAKEPANRAQAALVIYNINKYADGEGK